MQTIQTTRPQQAAQVSRTAPARVAAAAQPARVSGPSAASIANRMVDSPEALPLSAIPNDWVPVGNSQRRVDTRVGPLVLERGNVRVSRSDSAISVQQIDNKDIANITLRVDPNDSRTLVASTPLGTFPGRLTGGVNEFEFRGNDGRHNISIERQNGRVRFETEGFGVIDRGHLNVYDR